MAYYVKFSADGLPVMLLSDTQYHVGVQSRLRQSVERRDPFSPRAMRDALRIPGMRSEFFIESLPFGLNDVTAGSETELQAGVLGRRDKVDLPLTIEKSNYYANVIKGAESGDRSDAAVGNLEEYLHGNHESVWDNSWVRFPLDKLSPLASETLYSDLLANRSHPNGGFRPDMDKFVMREGGRDTLRVPISYLIKLSLADVLGKKSDLPHPIEHMGRSIMSSLLNDNTSPEVLSFYVVPLRLRNGFGHAVANETAGRFLLTQLLIMYANRAFSLTESGQHAVLYFSPHPPVRQKRLNDCISDSYYRELFMSPCLSGWDDGCAKQEYMKLCHQVLSRSRLNGVARLRDAGIITRNIVVLPTLSNISLANNGTHISLGSLKLTEAVKDERSGFTGAQEKYLGDLVIKIVEHFLPLFVRTYSAAPYRIDFSDFHPEKVLGFLPHELDYTHLRMIWRRWKKKAHLRVFGHPLTPFGLRSLDRLFSGIFGVRGDVIPDFRLVDYLMTPLSTDRSPALDGIPGNDARLKKDLEDLGVFDARMSLYTLYRLRECEKIGFSGFEGRYYSLFESLTGDVTHAANLQTLVTALAFKYIFSEVVTHRHIPDEPFIESERRQIFFGSSIGVPTFFVRSDTKNLFLRRILDRTNGIRYSRRYPGYLRVYNRQYRLALVDLIRADAADLIEMLNLQSTMDDLKRKIEESKRYSADGRLTSGILRELGTDSPLQATADEFNLAAERYYRTTLRKRHLKEAMELLTASLAEIESGNVCSESCCRETLRYILKDRLPSEFMKNAGQEILSDDAPLEVVVKAIHLLLFCTYRAASAADRTLGRIRDREDDSAPICRAGNW